jgi:ribosomal protein S12 methylthiotransferase
MKILLVSLGCDKNRVDSEKMLSLLSSAGYELTDDETEAEAVIVNTCCFISDAKSESIRTILEMAELKKTAKVRKLIVTGCMANRYRDDILKEIPEADEVAGTGEEEDIVKVLDRAFGIVRKKAEKTEAPEKVWETDRIVTTGAYAYLKIADGCDKNCTYCVIPSLRGHYRSVPMEELVLEASKLAAGGVRELILVAQETTLYGMDLYGKKSLHILLRKLCRIPHLKWIRILYSYPEEIYPEMIETMKREKKICHYLDLPIQHCSDGILKAMNRRTSKADLVRIISGLREEIPDIVLRTTLISGFPGETEKEQKELLAFIRRMKFDRLGVFPYSKEEGTPAAKMKGQVPVRIRRARAAELMEAQQKISKANGKKRIGSVMEAVIEGYMPDEAVYAGRSYGDTPDVDGYVFIETRKEWMTGDFLKVRITGASEYDLQGVPADEYTE